MISESTLTTHLFLSISLFSLVFLTLGTIKQHKSRYQAVNKEWKIIQQLLLSHHIDSHPQRVTSQENKADALSRGIRLNHNQQDVIRVVLPDDLIKVMKQT